MKINHNRANIVRSNIVVVTNIDAQVKTDGVDIVITRGINYAYLKQYMELRSSFVWGLKLEGGVFYPVEIVLPITQDLDGWVAINKTHVMFDEEGATNPREFAKERLIHALATVYPQPVEENGLATLAATA